ncbi:DotU family type IV/VI secretion system protein [Pigmentibacter sp. JX0631]|uniref:DotU family type IV/VI secretion system protein n=1 Tax=Pigmentibacter sp. JX0631 TaxID=2976982 RepID=UPI0024691287|nr:DotU family type IV/VI secretion system protein [Pigmentibacter sp. JX0631]WGL59209.1 DotU family type IV/VI secretion system protein [Pigmentibacter sp. JX0631]
MKSLDLSSIECLILTTEDAITYFSTKITDYNSKIRNIEDNDNISHDNNNQDFHLISSEIEEFISRKIDSLKKNKKYFGSEVLKYLNFALIAVVDEMMITQNWPGQNYWQEHSLESRLLFSNSAGDLFYDNCEKILLNRDYKTRELAYCYFLCLSAGFKGKYHNSSDFEKIEVIKTNLYQFYIESNSEIENRNMLGVLPTSNYEPSDNEFEIRNKKINYSLMLTNIFLFAVFLAFSIYIWVLNNNILTKSIQ